MFTTHAIYISLFVKAEVTPQGIKVHFTELTLLAPRRDYMITSVRSTDVTSPCTGVGEKKPKQLANAKRSIKYCWKYDLLQQSCIWSYLSYYSESEVCWHGEALNLERLSPRDIPVPADTEMKVPVVQLPAPAQPQAGSDSNNHIQSAHSSSHSNPPAGSTDTVAVDKTHTPKFLLCTMTALVLFLCSYQSQTAEFPYMKYLSAKKFSVAQFLTRKKESDKTTLTSCCHFVST